MKDICRGRTAGCHEQPAGLMRHRHVISHSCLLKPVELLLVPAIAHSATARAIRVASATQPQTQPLTPRQRRLAQQRRKWEAEQRQQQQRELQQQQNSPSPPKHTASTAKGSETSGGNPGTTLLPSADQVVLSHDGSAPTRAFATRTGTSRDVHAMSTPARSTATASHAAAQRHSVSSPPQKERQRQHQRLQTPHLQQQQEQHQDQHRQQQQHRDQQQKRLEPSDQRHESGWPPLFPGGEGHPLRSHLDLHSLPVSQLISLARQWTEELVGWEDQHPPPSHARTSSGLASYASDVSNAGTPRPMAPSLVALAQAPQSEGRSRSCRSQSQSHLPVEVARRLALLTAAVDVHVTRGSLGHHELADLAWCIGHYDRQHSLQVLHPAMRVPFSVVPRFMPTLQLEEFMREIELRRDTIYLDADSRGGTARCGSPGNSGT
ncbi:hypothetical protein Vretimale_3200 [Volvox reticuliferus]|uniref:Uncharacterized protein n=1 Tax=Volvox reticuliferus TaxID=1737510 RepID=A0A8J4G172_9CHLO|nr:hypothetical protein Vretimale_3200 [Volvox reticuliferus]